MAILFSLQVCGISTLFIFKTPTFRLAEIIQIEKGYMRQNPLCGYPFFLQVSFELWLGDPFLIVDGTLLEIDFIRQNPFAMAKKCAVYISPFI